MEHVPVTPLIRILPNSLAEAGGTRATGKALLASVRRAVLRWQADAPVAHPDVARSTRGAECAQNPYELGVFQALACGAHGGFDSLWPRPAQDFPPCQP